MPTKQEYRKLQGAVEDYCSAADDLVVNLIAQLKKIDELKPRVTLDDPSDVTYGISEIDKDVGELDQDVWMLRSNVNKHCKDMIELLTNLGRK